MPSQMCDTRSGARPARAALDRIHALARSLEGTDGVADELEVVNFIAGRLKPGDVQLARFAGDLLRETVQRHEANCGGAHPPHFELLETLNTFAQGNGATRG